MSQAYVQVAGRLVCQFGFQVVVVMEMIDRMILLLTVVDKKAALLSTTAELDCGNLKRAFAEVRWDNEGDPLIIPRTMKSKEAGTPFRLSDLSSCTPEEALRLFPFEG